MILCILIFQKGGLAPLHIACAIPGDEGVQIAELLLTAGADPNVRAFVDDAFLNDSLVRTNFRLSMFHINHP